MINLGIQNDDNEIDASMSFSRKKGDNHVEIHLLAVKLDQQKKGLGTRLIHALKRMLQKEKVD